LLSGIVAQSLILSPGNFNTPSNVSSSLIIQALIFSCGLYCVNQTAKATTAVPAKMLAAMLKDIFFFF
jgi:hypothetical protein